MTKHIEGRHDALIDAVKHLRAAITILDQAEAPAHIAAHVDLAVNQIDDVISMKSRVRGLEGRDKGRSVRVL